MTATAFNSVKLPTPLVEEARSAALAFCRSTSGQIEYWAMLGKAVEESGITVREAKAVMQPTNNAVTLDAIASGFDRAINSGSLALRMREVIAANQQGITAKPVSQAKQIKLDKQRH